MSIPILNRSYEASAVIAPFRIVKFSDAAASSKIATAAAAADPLVGTTGALGASAVGTMADVTRIGIGSVQLGGVVTAGAKLTSDANGKAIATVTAGQRIIGFAEAPGVADDIIDYLAAPGVA